MSVLDERYRDLMPPPGWQPKSDFFKSIFAKAEFNRAHKKLTITCPDCGKTVILDLTIS